MKMKKIITAVLAMVVTFTLAAMLAIGVYGANPEGTLSGPSTPVAGEQITLKLKINKPVSGYTIDLDYNKDHLELVKTSTVNGWTSLDSGSRYTATAPMDEEFNFTTATEIFTVTFKVKSSVPAETVLTVRMHNIILTESDLNEVDAPDVTWSAKTAVPKSNDATLKSLTVTGYNIKFKPATTRYNLTVENDVTKLEVSAEVNDPKASMRISNPSSLKEGNSNRVRVYVTAEDGTEKTYTIVVTRQAIETEPPKSTDNTLKSLTVTGAVLDFAPDKTQYTLEVEHTVDALDIKAVANDDGATVEVKNNALVAGEKVTVQVIVTAENGDSRTYNLHVTRKAPETEPPKSSDNALKSLTVAGVTLDFASDRLEYAIEVENDVESLTIEAIANHEGAVVEVKNNALVVGETVTVQVVVTAENGDVRTYSIAVTRKAAETNPPENSGTGPIESGEPSDSETEPVQKPSDSEPGTIDQTVFWLNAIYIIILVGCLLVIALLLVLLVIYRRMNNSSEH